MKKIVLLALASLIFASCEVEFSPNADWTEIPVVYCLLDQDEDTTYVRVQRCFLGEGNQYTYAAVADSNNYPQGALTVAIEEWNANVDATTGQWSRSGKSPIRTFVCDYTETTDKENGIFDSSRQPLYVCATAGQLDTSHVYRLVVVKNSTGDTIATSETMLICGDLQLVRPNNVTKFQFAGTSGNKSCEFHWSAMKRARQYQPLVRFFYRDFIINRQSIPIDTTIINHYIDIPCNVVKSNMRDPFYTTYLDQNYFLSTIKNSIIDTVCNKNIIDTVEIFILSCTEPLAAFVYAGNPAGSLNQDPFTYTNIEGGLGVFAARRRHMSFRIETPGSTLSNYKKTLKELGVGF